jgi:CPA1 family monovalent cation:H+ antiporter
MFQTIAALVSLAAIASYVNHRFVRLPTTIGLMTIALVLSLSLVALDKFDIIEHAKAVAFVRSIDFSEIVLDGLLAFFLFAGALHVNLADLSRQKLPVAVLSTVGVVISTFVVGALLWMAAYWLGIKFPFVYALLFGALISPTDPIAVLGILKKLRAPKSLEMTITGESLFNDGIAVVLFLTILGSALGRRQMGPEYFALLLGKEILGGIGLGLGLDWIVCWLLRNLDAYQVEILLTLAVAAGSYALAQALQVSQPIAVVVAGLIIGNHGRIAMSEKTREHLDNFWELVDELLNAILFVLIGMEVMALKLNATYLLMGAIAIAATLMGRFASVAIPILIMRSKWSFTPGAIRILTWGGLRGGISIAMALSLPAGSKRDLILAATYIVVVFSVLVQGLTLERMLKRWSGVAHT